MKWSILTVTQDSRTDFLSRMLRTLYPQLLAHPQVAHDIFVFNPQFTLGENRQTMLEMAKGDYVSVIDDDDLVPPDYVSSILPYLDGTDYIGFLLQYYEDGRKQRLAQHRFVANGGRNGKGWYDDPYFYYRDISHLNPIRREIALKAKFTGGTGEDWRWASQIRDLGEIKTSWFIPRVLYHYYFRSRKEDFSQA